MNREEKENYLEQSGFSFVKHRLKGEHIIENTVKNQLTLNDRLRQKSQFNFGLVPSFVRNEFERLANQHQMGNREYFYYLLREDGADIPPYSHMDLRTR